MSKNILFAFLFLMGAIPSIAQKNYQVQSPNRDIKVEVTVADKVKCQLSLSYRIIRR